jgi:hypothetical protein
MFQKLLVFAALALPAGLLAQNQPYPGGQSQQTPPTVNVVTPGPNVYVVSGGLYGTGLYPLPYLPIAPSQNAAPPQAGTAGISFNAPTTYSGPGYSYSTPLYSSNAASPYYNATPVVPGSETTVAESGRQIIDLGPSYYASASAATVAAAPAPSLAEVAAQYRTSGRRSARTYTNADAWRLGGSQVVPGIIAANVLPAPPPAAPSEPEQTQAPAAGQTPPSPPAEPPRSATEAVPPPPNHAAESGKASSLPATSTLLPLLGTLGLLSGALGLWIARFRR